MTLKGRMRWTGALAVCTLAALLTARSASAALITFDDLPAGNASFGGAYAGLNWGGLVGVTPVNFGGVLNNGDGYAPLAVSGPNYGYAYCCGYPDEITVTSGTFDLVSGYFGGVQGQTQSYTVRGFIGVVEAYTQALGVTGTMTFFTLNMMGVDRVKFDSGANNLGMDNLLVNFNEEGPAPPQVPEPASLGLLGAGFAAGAVLRWKRRRTRPDR